LRYPDIPIEELEVIVRSPRSYVDAHPEPGAVEALRDLWLNFNSFIVTARPMGSRSMTFDWLKKWDIKFHAFHTATVDKADLLYAIHADAAIDDDPITLAKCEWLGIRGIVFDRPWNQKVMSYSDKADHVPAKLSLPRIKSWADYGKILDVLNGRPSPEKAKVK
jgi:5'(3')-deoxyribonucleotidase